MWESVLGTVVSSAANAYLSQQRTSSSGGGNSNGGFNAYANAMQTGAARSLMEPMRPKPKRESTPAQAVSNHPLRNYTDQFMRM